MTAALSLAVFLSGCAALLFETLWLYQAGLTLGNSIWASSLVLASFMAGLALGNGLMARLGLRIRQPLRLYAWLEGAVGLSGVAIVVGLPHTTPWLTPLLRALQDDPWRLNAVRFLAAFACLLLPCTAMGATLPVLVGGLMRRQRRFGRVLGGLYGWNTLGAMTGALLGEGVLIGWWGIRGTAAAAAVLNGMAALLAFAVARRVRPTAPVAGARQRGGGVLSRTAVAVLAAACLCGAILLSLETAWFRLLKLFVPGDSFTFAVLLSVVLAGIGAGGLVGGWWLARRPAAFQDIPLVACASGVLGLLGLVTFEWLLRRLPGTNVYHWDQVVGLSVLLMTPSSLASGILFTLLGEALHTQTRAAVPSTGLLTLANTLGAVVGALATPFLLIPRLGLEPTIRLLAVSYGLVAISVIAGGLRPAGLAARAALACMVAALAIGHLSLASGVVEQGYWRHRLSEFIRSLQEMPIEMREGSTETAILLQHDRFGEPVHYRLLTNSGSMSGTRLWVRRYMKLFVYLPAAVHPDLRHALLISYGVGNTARALTDLSTIETIDVAEISPDILALSRRVHAHPEDDPLNDPRVRVHLEDGRHFLQVTDRRFDLITGEPPPPKYAGVVSLFTREYFQLMADRLAEGGIATYWLPVHDLTVPDTRAIIGAFCGAFPDCSLWNGNALDWILMGTRHARGPVEAAWFTRLWRDPRIVPELRALGFEEPAQLGAVFLADAEALRTVVGTMPPLCDDRPKRLSDTVVLQKMVIPVYGPWLRIDLARERFAHSALIERLWPPAVRQATLEAFGTQRLLNVFGLVDRLPSAQILTALHEVLTTSTLRTLPMWLLGSTDDEQRAADAAVAKGRRAADLSFHLGVRAMADRAYGRAAEWFRDSQEQDAQDSIVLYSRLYALCLADRCREAQALWAQTRQRGGLDAQAKAVARVLASTFDARGFTEER